MRDLAAPRRQHIVGLLVLIGWQSRHMLRAAWPILLAAYVQQDSDAKYFLWAIAVGAHSRWWVPCFTFGGSPSM